LAASSFPLLLPSLFPLWLLPTESKGREEEPFPPAGGEGGVLRRSKGIPLFSSLSLSLFPLKGKKGREREREEELQGGRSKQLLTLFFLFGTNVLTKIV